MLVSRLRNISNADSLGTRADAVPNNSDYRYAIDISGEMGRREESVPMEPLNHPDAEDGQDGEDGLPAQDCTILLQSLNEVGSTRYLKMVENGRSQVLVLKPNQVLYFNFRGSRGGHGGRGENGFNGRQGAAGVPGKDAAFFRRGNVGGDGEDGGLGGNAGNGGNAGHPSTGGNLVLQAYDPLLFILVEVDVRGDRRTCGGLPGEPGMGGRGGPGGRGGAYWSS